MTPRGGRFFPRRILNSPKPDTRSTIINPASRSEQAHPEQRIIHAVNADNRRSTQAETLPLVNLVRLLSAPDSEGSGKKGVLATASRHV